MNMVEFTTHYNAVRERLYDADEVDSFLDEHLLIKPQSNKYFFAVMQEYLEDYTQFAERLNAYVEQGYKVHTFNADQGVALMSHSDTAFIANAVDLVNVEFDKNQADGTPLIAKMIGDGWRPIATYSKHVTLMLVSEDEQAPSETGE